MDPTTNTYITTFKEGLKIASLFKDPVLKPENLTKVFQIGFTIGSSNTIGDVDVGKLKTILQTSIEISNESKDMKIDPNIISSFEAGFCVGKMQAKESKTMEKAKELKLFVWEGVGGLNHGTITAMAVDKETVLSNLRLKYTNALVEEISRREPKCISGGGFSWTSFPTSYGSEQFSTAVESSTKK